MDKVVAIKKVSVSSGINKGGFQEVHGSFRVGKINDGGIRLLD